MKSIINIALMASLGASALAACSGGDASSKAIDGGSAVDAGTVEVADAGAPISTEDAAGDGSAPVALGVACGAALPGAPMARGIVESAVSYDDFVRTVADTDVRAVPDPLDYSTASALTRGLVNYMLERKEGTTLSRDEASRAGPFGEVILAAAAKGGIGGPDGGALDVTMLRRGLHHHYRCVRKVPTTLAGVRALYGDYTTWPTRTIACSRPKDGPRRLRENHESGVYVAETLAGEGAAAAVRETEILFENARTDGQLDFAVYTPEGDLTDRSTFATAGGEPVTSAAPYTCMACHTERGAFRYTVLLPDGTGAGCR
ncbi:MAG: hypothetical protein U0169_10070 [Polyangiaceae bacterium]